MSSFATPEWLTKEVSFAREKLEVRARSSEKSGWRRAFDIRSTKSVEGLPATIPGDMVWAQKQYRIGFGWKAILPIPSAGIGLHPPDEKGVYLLCADKECPHGQGSVKRMQFRQLAATIEQDFGLKTSYAEDFIYGQFYRSEDGAHTFVRLLPAKVDAFDPAVIDLLRARQMLRSLPFLFGGMDVLADLLIRKVHGPVPQVRARYLNAWRHALAIGRACQEHWTDDSLPGWSGVNQELEKESKADLKKVSESLAKLVPDKDGKWTVTGLNKAAAVVARAFFRLQGICLRAVGDDYLAQLGITLKRSGSTEEYRFPVDEEGRARFRAYLDQVMAVRQVDDRATKNVHPYRDALKKMLAEASSDIEVLEIFAMNLGYVGFADGWVVEVPAGLEKVVMPDLPSLEGKWTLAARIAQPQDDPDYPGFVVSVYRRGSDFIIAPKGTSSEDKEKAQLSQRTRDQADKRAGVCTGVEADGDPAGVAYHAVKKYKKELLQKLKDLGATPSSKFVVTGHSLGGALTERLHLKLYEAGYQEVWSLAFSPPAPDARTISKALFKDDAMGPAAFDRLAASGGTWDVVTKGGDTGACIPLRLLCIRPWAPGTFTPVPYSVVGDNSVDQRILQHGTMFQHECRYAGFALVQERLKGDRVNEDTGKSYVVYDYCKDVTRTVFEATRVPWAMETIMSADKKEHATRVEFSKVPATDAQRDKQGSVSKSQKMVLVLGDEKALHSRDRKAMEEQVAAAAKRANAEAKVMFVSGAKELEKKLQDASWAKGCILNLGPHDKDMHLQDAVRALKFTVVEVHAASWKQTGQGANEPHHIAGDGLSVYTQAMDWLSTRLG